MSTATLDRPTVEAAVTGSFVELPDGNYLNIDNGSTYRVLFTV